MQPSLPPEIMTIMRAVIEAHHIFEHLDKMSLACRLDEHFDIYLPDEAIAGWERVADVIASVRGLISDREARAA